MKKPLDILTRAVEKVVPEELANKKLNGTKKLRVYLGIDPTGAKLHLGHAVPLRKLQAFADAGHHAVFLVGNFTAMVGDPTGQDKMRKQLTEKQVKDNFKSYKKQASKIIDFRKVEIRYNNDWHKKVGYKEIFEMTKNFTIQQILKRDMFKKRMSYKSECPKCKYINILIPKLDTGIDQIHSDKWPWDVVCEECKHEYRPDRKNIIDEDPIYPVELLYPIMQGYDSVQLDVDFEIGGNDQLFNMLCGREMQKAYGKRDKCVLTTKLLEGTDGRKMSKTYNNCIYFDDSPKDMYDKTLSINDDLIKIYFECCTSIPNDEVIEIVKGDPRKAKVILAKNIITQFHGEKAAENIEDHIPSAKAKKDELLLDVLTASKIIESKSDGRRLIKQGGIKVNDKPVGDIEAKVEEGVVKVGKKKFLKIKVK